MVSNTKAGAFAKNKTLSGVIAEKALLTYKPTDRLASIVPEMHRKKIGAACVVDSEGQVVGLMTERQILHWLFDKTPNSMSMEDKQKSYKAQDVMIESPEMLELATSVDEALKIMLEHGYRFMPVVDQGKPVGIADIRTLFTHVQNCIDKRINDQDALISYFMHSESYGMGSEMTGT